MVTDSWLQPHLVAVLRDRGQAVLESWQKLANQDGGMKNFENWVLVELHHELLQKGFVVRVNGFWKFDGQGILQPVKVKAADVCGLRGSKAKATHLSADLSVWMPGPQAASQGCFIAELKTGISRNELGNDLTLVHHYRERGIAARAELGWIVLLPEERTARAKREDAFEAACDKLTGTSCGCSVFSERIDDWIIASVVVPNSSPIQEPPSQPEER